MSENYSLNGYTIADKTAYEALQKADLDTNKLKSIDKDSDGTISLEEYKSVEDDLVSVDDNLDENNNSSQSGSTSTDNSTNNEQVQKLQEKYDSTFKKIMRKQESIGTLIGLIGGAEAEVVRYAKDSDARSSAEELVNSLNGELENVRNEIANGYSALATLKTSIEQAKNQASNTTSSTSDTSTAAATDSTSASGTSSAGNVNVVSGSGKDLANVTGDLSTCLDNIVSSFNSKYSNKTYTREDVADYIATVCQEAGKGYFDPKIIVSLIFSESSGDIYASSSSDYVGFGQMSAVAVQEVNNQFGTNFTFADMSDPKNNIEALTYLLRFQYERYGNDLGKALTAYNVGNCESGVINSYATQIMSRVS